ncbi:MAG: DALR anticodon-binding domain-containing protein [Streptosporangiaceae bacterium]
MITAELRRALAVPGSAAGRDPLLRPGPQPGVYASHLPFRLARPGQDPRQVAAELAVSLSREPWVAAAEPTGSGYLTVTVTHDALAGLAVRIARAGPACAASDALRGRTVQAPPPADPAAVPGWPRARATLAAELTARLAATAGATISFAAERSVVPPPGPLPAADPQTDPVAHAVEYAGVDAVRFALARMPPAGAASWPRAAVIARHVLANPAYAVRYAHAAAAAVLRWAAVLGTKPAGFRPGLLAEPGELALLDALSWLPERVAMAARRGRPDEFARYLEELAAGTIDTMDTTGFTTISSISSERLWLADAARTALAAGLGLLGISAPGRL